MFQQQQRQQPSNNAQGSLFGQHEPSKAPPEPLSLAPQHLQFWRWPDSLQQGAALYFVFDHSRGDGQELLLYVGETCQADRRWKGEHDCKSYLAAYGEALVRCGQQPRFTIRFWCDAPADARARRRVEQQQIRHWLPPFNKECRQRWQNTVPERPPLIRQHRYDRAINPLRRHELPLQFRSPGGARL